jgi:hypothetical protein
MVPGGEVESPHTFVRWILSVYTPTKPPILKPLQSLYFFAQRFVQRKTMCFLVLSIYVALAVFAA